MFVWFYSSSNEERLVLPSPPPPSICLPSFSSFLPTSPIQLYFFFMFTPLSPSHSIPRLFPQTVYVIMHNLDLLPLLSVTNMADMVTVKTHTNKHTQAWIYPINIKYLPYLSIYLYIYKVGTECHLLARKSKCILILFMAKIKHWLIIWTAYN